MHLLINVCMCARHSEAEGGGTSKMHRHSPNQDGFPVKTDAKITVQIYFTDESSELRVHTGVLKVHRPGSHRCMLAFALIATLLGARCC